MRNMLTFRRAPEGGGEGQPERIRGKLANEWSREAAAVGIRKAFVEIKKPETGDPDNIMTEKRDGARGRDSERETERKRIRGRREVCKKLSRQRQSPRYDATKDNTQQY